MSSYRPRRDGVKDELADALPRSAGLWPGHLLAVPTDRWLGALFLALVLYALLHMTVMNEWWSRPVSRALQATAGLCATLALAVLRRDRPRSSLATLVIAALTAFSAASLFLHSRDWTTLAGGFAAVWLLALFATLRGDR